MAPFSHFGEGEGCSELEGTSESALSNEVLVPLLSSSSSSEKPKPSISVDVELDDEGLLDSMIPGMVIAGLVP